MLKYSGVKIELISEIHQFLFVEEGVRGGTSQCSKRYARANNKYMSDFNCDEKSNYIMYLDSNNLYGGSMMENLPIGGYSWVNKAKKPFLFSDVDLPDSSETGYIFEIDIDYPKELHDLHNDYPFLPERTLLPPQVLPFLHEKNVRNNQPKLMQTLFDKKNYVVHYKIIPRFETEESSPYFAIQAVSMAQTVYRVKYGASEKG